MKFKIVEIFTAKAGDDWNHIYYGTICLTFEGTYFSRIELPDSGYVISTSKSRFELGNNLDELVSLSLNYDIFSDSEKFQLN